MRAAGERPDISEAYAAQRAAGMSERRIWRSGWQISLGKSLLPQIPVMTRSVVHPDVEQNYFQWMRPERD
jgi:hypothetical protein